MPYTGRVQQRTSGNGNTWCSLTSSFDSHIQHVKLRIDCVPNDLAVPDIWLRPCMDETKESIILHDLNFTFREEDLYIFNVFF